MLCLLHLVMAFFRKIFSARIYLKRTFVFNVGPASLRLLSSGRYLAALLQDQLLSKLPPPAPGPANWVRCCVERGCNPRRSRTGNATGQERQHILNKAFSHHPECFVKGSLSIRKYSIRSGSTHPKTNPSPFLSGFSSLILPRMIPVSLSKVKIRLYRDQAVRSPERLMTLNDSNALHKLSIFSGKDQCRNCSLEDTAGMRGGRLRELFHWRINTRFFIFTKTRLFS